MPISKQTIRENLSINIVLFAYQFHDETNGHFVRKGKLTKTYKAWLKERHPLVHECIMEVGL